MPILQPFTSPSDPRWRGPQHHHHTIFLFKTLLLIPFIILVITDYALFTTWWASSNYPTSQNAPYAFWVRIGIALLPEVLYTLIALSLILQTPASVFSRRAWTLHPGVALACSMVLLGLWVVVAALDAIVLYANEVGFENVAVWYGIGYAEVGMQCAVALCYVGMMVCACVAVHRERVGGKKREGFVELGEGEGREGKGR